MAGIPLQPFPRQTLVANVGAAVSYFSETYDLKDYRSLAWWIQTYASLPATVNDPVRMYLQASNDEQGPWVDLIPGGEAPLIGDTSTGALLLNGRYLRTRVDISADEVATFVVRLVARTE